MSPDHDAASCRQPTKGLLRRLLKRRDGASAIEFALLALPFFIIIFASFETFLAFSAEQVFANANEAMARQIRTGQIKAANGEAAYRKAFCEEIKILMPCSTKELTQADKLFIHVESVPSYSAITKAVTLIDGDLDTSKFKFAPGGKQSINIVRAYYRWDIITDLVRPMITNVRSADGSRSYLMVATVVIQNEDF